MRAHRDRPVQPVPPEKMALPEWPEKKDPRGLRDPLDLPVPLDLPDPPVRRASPERQPNKTMRGRPSWRPLRLHPLRLRALPKRKRPDPFKGVIEIA